MHLTPELLLTCGIAILAPLRLRYRPTLRGSRHAKASFVVHGAIASSSTTPERGGNMTAVFSKFRQQWKQIQLASARHRPQSNLDMVPDGAERITLIAAAVNILLTVVKLVVGVSCRSVALVADAGHSLSDLVGDGITLWAVRLAHIPPDEDHPYGHGRFETVGALGVGILVIAAGAGIGKEACTLLHSFASGYNTATALTAPAGLALAVCVLSIVSKEMLFRATDIIGRRLNSPVLRASATHHRSDAWSSVVAAIGVIGTLFGFPILDPLAAIGVAVMVLRMGAGIAVDALSQLTDTTDEGIVRSVEAAALLVPGAVSVNEVRARAMGSHWHVETVVTPSTFVLSVTAAAHLAAQVRRGVLSAVPQVQECMVRVHSSTIEHLSKLEQLPDPQEVDTQVRQVLGAVPEVREVKRTMTHYDITTLSPVVEVWIEVSPELSIFECKLIAESSRRMLLDSELAFSSVHIHLALLGSALQVYKETAHKPA